MPNGKTAVTAHFDNEETTKLQQYMERHGLESQGNAVRKLTAEAMRRQQRGQEWLLSLGLAAAMLSVSAVAGVLWWRLDWLFGGAAIYTAIVFLSAYLFTTVRNGGISMLPVVGRWWGRPVDR